MIETIALLATMSFTDVASLIAMAISSGALIISYYKSDKKEAEDNAVRMSALENEIKELKVKYEAMESDVNKLSDSLNRINTKQEVMSVTLDQVRSNVAEILDYNKNVLNKFMMETQSSLVRLETLAGAKKEN